jgi:MerR family mercuric resistance operon transcriptional regulator
MFTIGPLSQATDCPIETIRYYERIGLLEKPFRTEGGHRLYNEKHQKRLEFILKTRQLGFTLEQTRQFLNLSQNTEKTCNEALDLVQQNMQDIEQKLIELQAIHKNLSELAISCKTCCPGGKATECTIVDAFSSREKQSC